MQYSDAAGSDQMRIFDCGHECDLAVAIYGAISRAGICVDKI